MTLIQHLRNIRPLARASTNHDRLESSLALLEHGMCLLLGYNVGECYLFMPVPSLAVILRWVYVRECGAVVVLCSRWASGWRQRTHLVETKSGELELRETYHVYDVWVYAVLNLWTKILTKIYTQVRSLFINRIT